MGGSGRVFSQNLKSLRWNRTPFLEALPPEHRTDEKFPTVNGVKAKGGAIDGPGVVVSGGMVYVNSGYVSLIGRPGNVLLAFGVE